MSCSTSNSTPMDCRHRVDVASLSGPAQRIRIAEQAFLAWWPAALPYPMLFPWIALIPGVTRAELSRVAVERFGDALSEGEDLDMAVTPVGINVPVVSGVIIVALLVLCRIAAEWRCSASCPSLPVRGSNGVCYGLNVTGRTIVRDASTGQLVVIPDSPGACSCSECECRLSSPRSADLNQEGVDPFSPGLG